jgi:hypothetical protein
LVTLALVVWSTGALDAPLSSVGLNKEDCAANLFGVKKCGDELLAFCEASYDRELNADACDDILREAGTSGGAVLARQRVERRERAKRAREAAQQRRQQQAAAARISIRIGDTYRLGDVSYTVKRIATSTRAAGQYSPILPDTGRSFVIAEITYLNSGRRPLDILCAAGDNFRLADSHDRVFSADGDAMFDAALNEEACSREVQPGDRDDAAIIFQVAKTVSPADLLIGQLNDPPPPGTEPYLAVAVP